MIRRGTSYQRKEQSFVVSQHVNDVLLPTYNALRDPYLSGFFDNPCIKKHLKETGVVKKKRKMSLKWRKKLLECRQTQPLRGQTAEQPRRGKSIHHQNVRLPALDELTQHQRKGVCSAGTSKRVYRSNRDVSAVQ